jgi:predicted nuclease with TOPRIM domain
MSDADKTAEEFLAALEAKVARAVALLRDLKAERRDLLQENAELKRNLDASGAGATLTKLKDLEAQLAVLDGERARLLADRKAMTRRMEDVLARLEFLESESAAH